MGQPSIAYPIDSTGRILITDAADTKVASATITVTTSRVTLTTNTMGLKRRKLLVRNSKSSEIVVYIGDSTVTDETGVPLYKDDELTLDVTDGAVVKAVRENIGAIDGELRIMEIE